MRSVYLKISARISKLKNRKTKKITLLTIPILVMLAFFFNNCSGGKMGSGATSTSASTTSNPSTNPFTPSTPTTTVPNILLNTFPLGNKVAEKSLLFPSNAIVSPSGDIYSFENINHRMIIFDSLGNFKSQWTLSFDVQALAWHPDGSILMANSSTSGINKYTLTGTKIAVYPTAGTVSSILTTASGTIYYTLQTLGKVVVANSNLVTQFSFGALGTGPGLFSDYVTSMALDSQGNIYVSDYKNSKVEKFNSNGVYVSTIGPAATSTSSALRFPSSVLIGPSDQIYLADTTCRIFILNPDGSVKSSVRADDCPRSLSVDQKGNLLYSAGNAIARIDQNANVTFKITASGSAPGQFFNPGPVALDTSGNIFVLDTSNYRIQAFDALGKVKFQIADPAENFTNAKLATDASGNIYALTSSGTRILKYDSTGKLISRQIFSTNNVGIAAAPNGNIYIGGVTSNKIYELSSAGTLLRQFSGPGTSVGELSTILNLKVSADGNSLFVLDWPGTTSPYSYRVQKFNLLDPTKVELKLSLTVSDYFPDFAVDSKDSIYLPSSSNQILIYGSDGNLKSKFGSMGYQLGNFNSPKSVALDSKGNIYVSESNQRVQKFDPAGHSLLN